MSEVKFRKKGRIKTTQRRGRTVNTSSSPLEESEERMPKSVGIHLGKSKIQFKSKKEEKETVGMVKELIDDSFHSSGTAAQLLGRDSNATIEVSSRKIEFGRGNKFMGKDMKRRYGPRKGPDNVRTTTFFDYQPDVCKDYKETGYCGYGDSCKFLHDRSDYKAGWEIEKEWEEKRYGTMQQIGEEESSSDDESVPFACLICRKRFTVSSVPIVTSCGHNFCQKCASAYHKRTKKCFACGQPTNGVFNLARDVVNKLKQIEAETSSPTKEEASED